MMHHRCRSFLLGFQPTGFFTPVIRIIHVHRVELLLVIILLVIYKILVLLQDTVWSAAAS
jgi:hypothetical protein